MRRKEFYVNGKLVGVAEKLEDVNMYVTDRIASKHYFIKHRGYGISDKILNELDDMGVEQVLIRETRADGSVKHIISNLSWWFTYGISIQFQDYDAQTVLPLKQIRLLNSGETTLNQFTEK